MLIVNFLRYGSRNGIAGSKSMNTLLWFLSILLILNAPGSEKECVSLKWQQSDNWEGESVYWGVNLGGIDFELRVGWILRWKGQVQAVGSPYILRDSSALSQIYIKQGVYIAV